MIVDDFNVEDYLEGATIYSMEQPAKETLKNDLDPEDAFIPEDVLSGKRSWDNLYWDKDDPRNAEGIMIMKER